MKTPLRVLAIGVLVLGLAACSDNGGEENDGATSPSASTPVQAPPDLASMVGEWKFTPTGALEYIVFTMSADGTVTSAHNEASPDLKGTVTANPDGTFRVSVSDGATTIDYRLVPSGRSEALTAYDMDGKEVGTLVRN